jgi:Glycosyltransferase family 87
LRPLARKDWWLGLGLLAFLALVAFGATERAAKQRIGTDFHVFWQAGYDFAHGLPLYHRIPGARKFIYPPFAAQVFQLFGIFPLRTAAWLFYVASALLVLAAAKLSRDIIDQLEPSRRRGRLPLILALLFSLNFILNNLNMVQVNLLVFTLCLLGISAFIRDKEPAASGWIVAATAIKLTPLFFVIWALIRGRRRTWLATAGAGLLCVVLPMLQRGVGQGIVDLKMYYRTFLKAFAAGGVIPDYTNQNLAALVYRAVVPMSSHDTPAYDYAYLPSLQAAAPLIYRVLATLILAVFLGHLLRLRIQHRPRTALEISSVFLASHLLSGITWKAHLVTLLFVAYSFFALNTEQMSAARRAGFTVACAGIAVIGLGRDVIGSRLHHYVGGYSLIVWVMLLLFALSVVWTHQGERTSVSAERNA